MLVQEVEFLLSGYRGGVDQSVEHCLSDEECSLCFVTSKDPACRIHCSCVILANTSASWKTLSELEEARFWLSGDGCDLFSWKSVVSELFGWRRQCHHSICKWMKVWLLNGLEGLCGNERSGGLYLGFLVREEVSNRSACFCGWLVVRSAGEGISTW